MKIYIFILFIDFLFSCSVAPNFQQGTLQEQVDYAGGIVVGTVTQVSNQYNADVTLNNLTYYRGCLRGSTIRIGKFVHSATCGAGIPQVGDKIIVFFCKDGSSTYKVNQFVPFMGWVAWSQNIQYQRSTKLQMCKRN